MIIYLNKNANSGRAAAKWEKVERYVMNRFPNSKIVEANDFAFINIGDAIAKGETEFISAGGDGTFNSLINLIISNSVNQEFHRFKVGAIGLGSSNDFHKPFKEFIDGIPVRIDFKNIEACDVGVIEYYDNGVLLKSKYWMINASIGILADANNHFNHKGLMWDFFKRHFVNGAILYSALMTIAKYKNKKCRLSSEAFGTKETVISNLGIAKNPNFAGEFAYPGIYSPANGLFSMYLMENKSVLETLLTFIKLWKRKGENVIQSGETDSIEISSDVTFNVEFDGEVVSTNTVRFSIINKAIQLCK